MDRIRRFLRNGVEWGSLSRMALRHGVLAPVYAVLKTAGSPLVPSAVLSTLEDSFRANVCRNLFLLKELLKLLDLLERNGIPALSLKGPVLAVSLYGDVGLRQFGDLDILVPKKGVWKTKEFLISHGYQPWLRLKGARMAAALQSQHHHQLIHPETGVFVELHWDLLPKFLHVSFDPASLWNRAQRMTLEGRRVLSLSDEDLMLFLCAHGAKHLWERLGWVCDVAQLVRLRPQIDWVRLIRSARRAGAQRMLFLGLFLANDLIGVELPPEISQKVIHDGQVKRLAVDMKKRFFKGAAGPSGFLELVPFYVRMRERWRDKVRDSFCHTLTLLTPTEEEWKFLSLPDFLFPLYYLLRPIRLAVKYGGRLLRIFGTRRGAEAGI